jgi:predicted nucleotidyltransferase
MMEKYNINQTTLKILLLYASDYKKSLHLREIARETKVDVKAVQLQLKRLEKINVLSSIVKGRNKEYRLNLNNLMTKYYMMLAETFASIVYLRKNFLIKKIISEVGNYIEGAILLFGSFAKGQITKKSDIDLFFIVEKKLDRSVVSEAGNLVGREISVKSASRRQFLKGLEDGDPLIREVVSNHIVLKGVDDFCEIMWRYHAR